MKSILICKSIHRGNTLKVAKAVSEVIGCEIKEPREIDGKDIKKYDLVGFASGIYIRDFHKNIKKLIKETKGKPCFILSTSGFSSVPLLNNYEKRMSNMLKNNGFKLLGSFSCRGHDEYGPFKLVGGIHKNRPNEQDLNRARNFAETIRDKFNSEESLNYDI